jgi:hypothetical protein
MVENEPWDPSVASHVAFLEVLITLGEKPDWVKNMDDAFLAQLEDVMNAVQRLRQKAQQAGNLKTNEQIEVSTQAPEPAPAPTTVVVQQSPRRRPATGSRGRSPPASPGASASAFPMHGGAAATGAAQRSGGAGARPAAGGGGGRPSGGGGGGGKAKR